MQTINEISTRTDSPTKIKIGHLLQTSKFAKIAEIILVFLVAFIFISLFKTNKADSLIYNQAVVWIANILMLLMVWFGINMRVETLADFGITFKKITWKFAFKTFLQSIAVLLLAIAGFILGSIVMANITGIPESSDMGGYDYLKNNFGMLLFTLAGVYIVSSFGEEVIYRAFLITRITQLGLNSKRGKIVAVIFSAIVFGLAHYSWGPMGIVQTGFMGLVFGFSYIYFKGRIWVLVIAHAIMDTILMLQMYLQ